jgi:hypothetical protein
MINNHLSTQRQYTFNAKQWGSKVLSINWKYILELWELRNKDVHGDTPEKAETIKQTHIIDEIIHIQGSHSHLLVSARALISRDRISLRAITTLAISAYLLIRSTHTSGGIPTAQLRNGSTADTTILSTTSTQQKKSKQLQHGKRHTITFKSSNCLGG